VSKVNYIMVFNFDNSKKVFLEKKDKSNKGSWDTKIVGLCDKLNSNDNYCTTSSCSGRIVLIIDAEKKKPGLFLFRTHDKISFDKLKKEIEGAAEKIKEGMVYFKQEPCILAVSSRNKEKQWELFNKAKDAGWKKSGVISMDKKFLVQLMSTEMIAFPVIDNSKVLVDDEFLKIVVKKANSNLERTWSKIERLNELV